MHCWLLYFFFFFLLKPSLHLVAKAFIHFEWHQNKISQNGQSFFFWRKYLNKCLQCVVFCHEPSFSSLVIRTCYVFMKLKAQQGSNKPRNHEKCLIPQETCMPIFLKPSHKPRISNVNTVHLCVYVCVSNLIYLRCLSLC